VSRLFIRRFGLAVLGGLMAVSVLVAVVAQVDEFGFVRPYNLGLLEWVVPVIAGVAVAAVAWLVLEGLPEEDEDLPHAAASCPACGRLILDDWRLCPHCGTLVEDAPVRSAGV
jgi:hypothetical protein